ncbi:MAG: glucokinase [Myxococcota bacterium]|nr:glucokinase [Myxococcota bacterium]
MLLALDIGGTNCRVSAWEDAVLRHSLRIPTAGPSLRAALSELLSGPLKGLAFRSACIALAGPVQDRVARLTNHPWVVDADALQDALGFPVVLANDFAAAAKGIAELPPAGYERLSGPAPKAGHLAAVLGPGTGLGQALVLPDGSIQATEGGHVDLAPNDPVEARLWQWMHERHGHVSAERVLSGPGLRDLQHFMHAVEGLAGAPLDTPAQVTQSESPSSQAAVSRFCRMLGAHAGNLALSTLPAGGVWLAGGIPPRLPLVEGGLLAGFRSKGRLSFALDEIPLMLVRDPDLGLRGAAAFAREAAPPR